MNAAAHNCPQFGGADDRRPGIGADKRDDCGQEQASVPVSLPALQPGDFYFDRGLMVLSRHYHLRRGYCCGNGCRHCPYPLPQ